MGCYLLALKAQTCHPKACLSCLPHVSPIILNPAILSLFPTQDYFWSSYQSPPDSFKSILDACLTGLASVFMTPVLTEQRNHR